MKNNISPKREHLQSWMLIAGVSATTILLVQSHLRNGGLARPRLFTAIGISAFFGAVVWLLRAATPGGIAMGSLLCLGLLLPDCGTDSLSWSSLESLIALFVISFATTRFGRSGKEQTGLAESRHGRQASQIAANLGAAAIFAAAGSHLGCIAALAEAAADTASSEIGQALGGRVRLLTTMKVVPAGTDGGVTLPGTLAGVIAALIVTLIGTHSTPRHSVSVDVAATLGLFVDSLLGATVERKGWLGNDLVNFNSTLFAGIVALLLAR